MVTGRRLGAAVLLAALVLLEGFFGLQPGHVAATAAATTTAAITGTVYDDIDVPAGAVLPYGLALVSDATITVAGSPDVAQTNSLGQFQTPALAVTAPFSLYTVEVSAPGFGSWTLSDAAVMADGLNLTVLLTSSDQSLTDSIAQLAPAGSLGTGTTGSSITPSSTSGCGGYFSNDTPPPTIRVFMTATDTIDTYNFRFYVEHVLPFEWYTTWPINALRAGAVAVEDYGWYWVNYWKGGSYNGQCYNVDDTKDYQVFNPCCDYASSDQATSDIWGWRYRNSSYAVFETSYSGADTNQVCGDGANGTMMQQWGTDACAQQGMLWRDILTTYYYPGTTFARTAGGHYYVAADGTGDYWAFLKGRYVQEVDNPPVQAYADAGPLYGAWQSCSSCTWSSWNSLSGSWPGDAVAVQDFAGQLQVFAVGNSNALYEDEQLCAGGCDSWSGWVSMGGSWPGAPAAVKDGSGDVNVFAVGNGRNLDWSRMTCRDCGWTSWTSLGGSWPYDPVATVNSKGNVVLLMVGTSQQLYEDIESSPTCASASCWSGWIALGGSWPGDPSVATNQDGRLEVFGVGKDKAIWHASEQTAGCGCWSAWTSLGGSWPSYPAVAQDGAGRLEVLAVGTSGQIYDSSQTCSGCGSWSGWTALGGNWPGDATVGVNPAGQLEVFSVGTSGYLYLKQQQCQGGCWPSQWTSLGGNWPLP